MTADPITWTNDTRKLSDLVPWEHNPKRMTKKQADGLRLSIERFGFAVPFLVSPDGDIYDGHQRQALMNAIKEYGPNATVDVRVSSRPLTDDERRELVVRLKQNQAGWDFDMLPNLYEREELLEWGFEPEELGMYPDDETSDPATPEQARQTLAERFLVPPFSVLDARQGYWQARKAAWIALGIRGELGRGADIVPNGSERPPEHDGAWLRHGRANAAPGGSPRDAANLGQDGKTQRGDGKGRKLNSNVVNTIDGVGLKIDAYRRQSGERPPVDRTANGKSPARAFAQDLMRGEHVVGRSDGNALGFSAAATIRRRGVGFDGSKTYAGEEIPQEASGTSIFDPVLCEVVFRWFTPNNGSILDPFAGEATKGIVATYLGYSYTGVELRPEQIEANQSQAAEIGVSPMWICGDSAQIAQHLPAGAMYDLVFTSPPYYDLEIYSESEKDGSAFETYEKFMAWYRNIFAQAVARLNNNRFLVVKIGEIRDKKGAYRNFVGDNISCFLDLGLTYYNEAILVTAVGSLPIRVGKQFSSGRKLGKTHQNILVFYKGDPRTIKQHFPQGIEHADLSATETD